MSSSINKVFDNVPDCVGYLIMNEDGSVEHSHGDLQNNEQAANLIYKMVLCAAKVSVHPTRQLAFKRFTVSDDQYVYCIACANHRIYVAKRRQESSTLA
ncbi:unnamed protein product [Rotaria sordida]|uniref:Late endosomal/lysosomal adaptor and MAPK and MTOR activator 4 n=3 Tax=Rotaria sordida TaxID=392033 RepID=A0A815KNQ8_9BILA|nr:unnamed protein product [Rotaria sordida]CAF1119003.1 unnamed protein product [Rotaria sordida]CAF1299820.1 unnamed protein product [Rotaria sordida]CAF1389157.1 unnamed protein product [Rotaria sordida]CAF1392250.1 unnamed protein product [Rotaria sordida]